MTSTLFGKTYRVVENPHEQDAAIELIEGEWKGLVYQYGKVGFEEGKPSTFVCTIDEVSCICKS